MLKHKHIDIFYIVTFISSLLISILAMNGAVFANQNENEAFGYENRLFRTDIVHTIDIEMNDWDSFIATVQKEKYKACTVVIDGEVYENVGIRGKGNTSLSSVASMGSDRYSFKIEFDKYDKSKSYYGLDKLCLNNIIQDNTYMKDYLAYTMMNQFDVDAPLCSYTYMTVNGEEWGLYLAVEGVEEAFLQRNYGTGYGDLYKPDIQSIDGWQMPDGWKQNPDGGQTPDGGPQNQDWQMPEGWPQNQDWQMPEGWPQNQDWQMPGGWPQNQDWQMPGGWPQNPDDEQKSPNDRQTMFPGGKFPGGMFQAADVMLQYIDDDVNSYSNLFDNAKTDVSEDDKIRLITSLKKLSGNEDLDAMVNIDEVLRYFIVHNFVVNDDSYTGWIIHNYYLYEENGQLSMIPWDYNLAFGTFQASRASDAVNDDIDEVLSDRPMQAWIFSDETYFKQYYELYAQFLNEMDIQNIIENTYTLIDPYVAKDPTAFCSYEEFQTGVTALKKFCSLRSESVTSQLEGKSDKVDTGDLNLSDMGTMSFGKRNNKN